MLRTCPLGVGAVTVLLWLFGTVEPNLRGLLRSFAKSFERQLNMYGSGLGQNKNISLGGRDATSLLNLASNSSHLENKTKDCLGEKKSKLLVCFQRISSEKNSYVRHKPMILVVKISWRFPPSPTRTLTIWHFNQYFVTLSHKYNFDIIFL